MPVVGQVSARRLPRASRRAAQSCFDQVGHAASDEVVTGLLQVCLIAVVVRAGGRAVAHLRCVAYACGLLATNARAAAYCSMAVLSTLLRFSS